MNKSIVIWDWNGTLFDDVAVCLEVMNDMLRRRNLPVIESEESYREIFSFPVSEYYKKAGLDLEHESFDKLAGEYMQEYNLKSEKCPLYENSLDVLEALDKKGVVQIIASASKTEALAEQVGRFPIRHFFQAFLGVEDSLGKGKSGLAYEYLQSRGITSAEALFVGDSVHDYEVAKAVGCDCVLIAGGHQSRRRLMATGARVLDRIDLLPAYLEEQISMRPLEESDTEDVFSMTSDPQVARYMRFDTHTHPEQARELICQYSENGNPAYLIIDTKTQEAAGVAALKKSGEEGVYDLSIFLAKRFWGKGFSAYAMERLLEQAEGLEIKGILGYVVEGNVGSRRLLEKFGFTVDRIMHFEGQAEGLYVYLLDIDGKMKETKG